MSYVIQMKCAVGRKVLWTCHTWCWSRLTTSRTLPMLRNIDTCSKRWASICYSTGRTWKLVGLSGTSSVIVMFFILRSAECHSGVEGWCTGNAGDVRHSII